ncbi:hypothetical protein [Demequina sp. NBRC 110056]|uniref:hypothetical protein n=1 Tax=Demequina sp. NBRC 110056 TaxID=1570345 RepID=UPI00117EDA89|nr:hypothetical protein [Demequina sp. NBRC 110056]
MSFDKHKYDAYGVDDIQFLLDEAVRNLLACRVAHARAEELAAAIGSGMFVRRDVRRSLLAARQCRDWAEDQCTRVTGEAEESLASARSAASRGDLSGASLSLSHALKAARNAARNNLQFLSGLEIAVDYLEGHPARPRTNGH